MRHPALVIGHYRDPIHPFSDSDMLVRELPDARLLEASSILELRLTPERLTARSWPSSRSASRPAARARGAPAPPAASAGRSAQARRPS